MKRKSSRFGLGQFLSGSSNANAANAAAASAKHASHHHHSHHHHHHLSSSVSHHSITQSQHTTHHQQPLQLTQKQQLQQQQPSQSQTQTAHSHAPMQQQLQQQQSAGTPTTPNILTDKQYQYQQQQQQSGIAIGRLLTSMCLISPHLTLEVSLLSDSIQIDKSIYFTFALYRCSAATEQNGIVFSRRILSRMSVVCLSVRFEREKIDMINMFPKMSAYQII